MSRPRKRVLDGDTPEEHVDERWMASYMDMVTVLMCLFIVLFAMSTVDQEKFEALRNSLATGFGAVDVGKIDTASGVVVPPEMLDAPVEDLTDAELTNAQLAGVEIDNLLELQEQLRSALASQSLDDDVTFVIDQRGLTIGLIGWESYFQPNSTTLSGNAIAIIDTITPLLAASAHTVSVEGHADFRGAATPFPTDWELSSGRATQVLRRMVETGGFPGSQISSVGYGSTRPQRSGDSIEDMAYNRRVDVAVLSNQPESVRELIPGAITQDSVTTPARTGN